MVIDPEETKKSLFGGLKSSTCRVRTSPTPEVAKKETPSLPKWKTLEKVTVLLTNQQRDAVEDLARSIMRHRSHGGTKSDNSERITANTVVRALIDNLIETAPDLAMKQIHNEEELKAWLSQLFSTNHGERKNLPNSLQSSLPPRDSNMHGLPPG